MESPAKTSSAPSFRTPPHILIPKLAKSRDNWKARAAARRRQYRKEKIRSRDLANSRERWKERALAAEQKAQELQSLLDGSEADLAQTRSDLDRFQEDAKKN
jgi:tRNA U38,U39,U40 pseudouridine synthase TruA